METNLTFEIIKSISVVIASGTAIYGISSWRREAKWKRKYELAEEVLSLFYEIKERLDTIRSPFTHIDEGKTRKRKDNENSKYAEILDQAYVVIERYEREKEPFIKLKSLKYRFMTVYGKDAGDPFDEIDKLINKIFNTTRRLGQLYWEGQRAHEYSPKQLKEYMDKKDKFESIIWADYKEEGKDDIREEVEKIISKIENYCKSIMKIKSRKWDLFKYTKRM